MPFFQDLLKSSRSVFLAAGPRCFIMSFVMPSGPGAFLHFSCLIAAPLDVIMIIIVIINLIYTAQIDTNGILTVLSMVITYIQMQYVHI